MDGKKRTLIEDVIKRLLSPLPDTEMGTAIYTFWNEFKDFQNKENDFGVKACWNSPDAINGNSHLWHEKYSLPYSKVLGIVHVKSCQND